MIPQKILKKLSFLTNIAIFKNERGELYDYLLKKKNNCDEKEYIMRRTYWGSNIGPMLSIWDVIDKILADQGDECDFQPSRQIRELQTNTAPFADIFVDEDKTFVIQAALAGIDKKDIKITAQNHEIELELFGDDKKEKDASREKEKNDSDEKELIENENEEDDENDDIPAITYLQRGIKKFGYLNTTWKIPKNWDMDLLKVTYENGLLTIKIPLKKEELKLMEKKQITID